MAKKLDILLAHTWDEEQDITGWWMSEKLDGVRAYWDGQRFLSRNGNEFFAPKWFTRGMPKQALDGELFVGRKLFNETVSIVRQHDAGLQWEKIKYLVFDAPSVEEVFEKRTEAACRLTIKADRATVLKQVPCRDLDHARQVMKGVLREGGEGLMFREPASLYQRKRSNTLLKWKDLLTAEGVVVAHEPGKGKHEGRLGALVVSLSTVNRQPGASAATLKVLREGDCVNVGTGFTDYQREHPPKIGSVVMYSYQELTPAGIPRFPSYLGERKVS